MNSVVFPERQSSAREELSSALLLLARSGTSASLPPFGREGAGLLLVSAELHLNSALLHDTRASRGSSSVDAVCFLLLGKHPILMVGFRASRMGADKYLHVKFKETGVFYFR